jgi:hypothetical protein
MTEEMDIDAWIIGLFVSCPLVNELSKCPMKNIRFKPLKERFNIIKNMTLHQKESFIGYHKECMELRRKE